MVRRYLLRFDDICPTMNWRAWERIEAALGQAGARPILAVVPDNRDPKLTVDPPAPDFWERVRGWQARGWTIALHGHQHVYTNDSAGILNLPTRQSEFAGVPRADQAAKLDAGLGIFAQEGVRPDCWVAPSHSFDWTTVELLAARGVKTISDGLWPWPHTDGYGVTWVPQQLWDHPHPMPPGVWTVCHHHNRWGEGEIRRFERDVRSIASRLAGLEEVHSRWAGRSLTAGDRASAWTLAFLKWKVRPLAVRLVRGAMPGPRARTGQQQG